MTNPAIRMLLPLSWARHDRLRSRSLDEDDEGANATPPDEPIEIVRFDDDEPLELLADHGCSPDNVDLLPCARDRRLSGLPIQFVRPHREV